MSNLNYTLSKIYNNLFTFFKYKKLIPLDDQVNDSEFIKEIFNNEYFIIKTVPNIYSSDEQLIIKNNITNSEYTINKKYDLTYYIIFHYNSDLYLKTQELKKILIKLKNTIFSYKIVLITKIPVSTHVQTFINTINNKLSQKMLIINHLTPLQIVNTKSKTFISNYTYKLFTIIIPNHILSNKHEILNNEEAEKLLNNVLLCKRHNLPKIKLKDPQIIWSPGNINDIVKITRHDDITGLSIYYRIIIE